MTLQELLVKYEGKLSLKKVCDTMNVCYQYALKVSKLPVKGEVYDPTKINYSEVEKVINRKGNIDDYDWEDIVNAVKNYEPLNQLTEFGVGTQFRFRYDDKEVVRTIVFMTNGYVVHTSSVDDNEKPSVQNNDTFLHQSPRIVK